MAKEDFFYLDDKFWLKLFVSTTLHLKGVANTLKQVEPEDGVTVIFHVVLASNLNMEEGHMHIQAEGEDLGDFKINCVDMKLVRLVCFCKYRWVNSTNFASLRLAKCTYMTFTCYFRAITS